MTYVTAALIICVLYILLLGMWLRHQRTRGLEIEVAWERHLAAVWELLAQIKAGGEMSAEAYRQGQDGIAACIRYQAAADDFAQDCKLPKAASPLHWLRTWRKKYV